MNYIQKGALPGTATKTYLAIQENMSPYMAVSELLHNSIEHGKCKYFSFLHKMSEDGKRITEIKDDGNAMSFHVFKKFVREYKCHILKNSVINNSSLSFFGNGLKDSCIYFSNPEKNQVSRCVFETYCSDGHSYKWEWGICVSDSERGFYNTKIEEIQNLDCKRGFHIRIENSKPLNKNTVEKLIRDELGRSFSNEKYFAMPIVDVMWDCGDNSEKKTVDTRVHFNDPMHYELLPNDINFRTCSDGIYVSKPIIWFKKTIVAYSKSKDVSDENKEIRIPIITAYFNQDYWKKEYKNNCDSILTKNCGVYVLKGNTYINRGSNIIPMLGITPNSGGSPRVRQNIILDDSICNIFGVKSMKMSGISDIMNNSCLTEEYITNEGISVFEAIRNEYQRVRRLQEWVRNVKGLFQHGDYKVNGFPKTEVFLEDYQKYQEYLKSRSESKKTKNTTEELFEHNLFPSSESKLYEIENEEAIISRTFLIDDNLNETVNYKLTKPIPEDISREDLLFSFFDVCVEVGLSPKQFQEIAKLLPYRLHNHE